MMLYINMIKNDMKNEFLKFIKEYNIDYLIIYIIRNKIAIRILSICKEKLKEDFNYSEFINLDICKGNIINKVISSNEIIFNYSKEGSLPFIKGVLYEALIPIKFDEKIIGCIYLGNIQDKINNPDIEKLNKILKENMLELKNIEAIKVFYKTTIEDAILINELFKIKSQFMSNHAYNVASWAIQIAKKMNYSEEELTKVYLASLLHDIGKIFIDEKILNKKGNLTEEEYNIMKKHVELGYNIIKDKFLINDDDSIPRWIYEHHERWDGKGFPKRLKGDEITKEGRILRIADALDAMISEKSYKNPRDLKEAILELKACKGKNFDPYITDVAIEIINERLISLSPVLDDVFLPSKVIIKTKNISINLDGYIFKEKNNIIFLSTSLIPDIENERIDDANLIFEKLNTLYEYKAQLEIIDTNKFIIKHLKSLDEGKTFSIPWLLSGKLIDPSTRKAYEITITKISGDSLVFTLKEGENLDQSKLYIITVNFEDGTSIPLTGKILKNINIQSINHYTFEYAGIKESFRDEIFRQIFRKQVNLKRILK